MTDDRLLRHLQLESFKSIVQLEQELGQLTVLVGENSAGKSSFMQAIVLASQIANSGSPSAQLSLNSDVQTLGSFDQLVHNAGFASDQVTIGIALAANELRAPFDSGDEVVSWTFSLSDAQISSGALLTRTQVGSTSSDFVFALIDDASPDEAERARADAVQQMISKVLELGLDSADPEIPAMVEIVSRGRAIFSGRKRGSNDGFELVRMDGALPSASWGTGSLRNALTRSYIDMLTQGKANWENFSGDAHEDLDVSDDYIEFLEGVHEGRSRDWGATLPYLFVDDSLDLSPPKFLEELLEVEVPSDKFIDRDHLTPVDSAAESMATFVRDTLQRRVHLLGPLREEPAASFRPGMVGSGIATIGLKGEYAVNYLDDHANDEVLCPRLDGSVRKMPLMRAVSYWLNELEIGGRIQTKQRGRQLEYDLIDRKTGKKRDLTSVGVGASQILPVIVLCLAAQPGELILLEQPELHLHPKPQQILGDFLLGISQTGRQLVVETHSEYLVNRLRLRMVEQDLDEEEHALKLLYAQRSDAGATTFDEIRPNKHGLFEGGWPDGFFDQSPAEAEKIVRAAVERRRQERAAAAEPQSGTEEI